MYIASGVVEVDQIVSTNADGMLRHTISDVKGTSEQKYPYQL